MNIGGDQSMAMLLAASGGDTVKLFDVSGKPGDPCALSYTPSPGSHVNSFKWNHTNLVVASAGDDRKISLWRTNGQSLGTIPVAGTDSGDNIDESIHAISFSNKVSRYVCTGGSGQVVRIWDLQRKRCIKWLKGHTNTITGAMYNCKDEYLASISLGGDLILHNLTSGARAAEFKDPNKQVLKVLDYSRISRHLLVTAGDDGTVHLWDTTGKSPKVSWLKQHSAPTAGISFSPSSDKTIASVGLDKKLYTYDSRSKSYSSCISYESPFSSLAYRDDGRVMAAGTSTGRVVFYDVRGKPEPFTVLRAYTNEAVSSLCWQRSKPVVVSESNCSAESALLGDSVEDSILMPDPLPSVLHIPSMEETPQRNHVRSVGPLPRLQERYSYNFKDEMDVFSPIVDVQPITPGLDKYVDDRDRPRKEHFLGDKKPSSFPYPPSTRRFSFSKDGGIDHSMRDWKQTSTIEQDDGKASFGMLGSTSSPSSKSEDTSITPPEAWGGEKLSDKYAHMRTFQSRSGMFTAANQASDSIPPDPFVTLNQSNFASSPNPSFNFANLQTKDVSLNQDISLGALDSYSLPASMSPGIKGVLGGPAVTDPPALSGQRQNSYLQRIRNEGTSPVTGSPKLKKTGPEPRDIFNNLLSKPDNSAAIEISLPTINGGTPLPLKACQQESQQGNSFTLQLFQRALEETLQTVQKSVCDDVRNLHIEVLRQFHLQEMEIAQVQNLMLENLDDLRKEVKALKEENQQLRQLL